jgi:hypothetical protein
VFTLLGQFITYVPGKYNQAIYINNQNTVTPSPRSWVVYNPLSSYELTVNNFSISSWVYPYTVNTSVVNTFFNMSPSASYYTQFQLSTSGSRSVVTTFTNGSSYQVNSIGNLSTGQWSHHCITYSNVGVTTVGNVFASYYINGVIQATSNVPQVAAGNTPLQFSVLNKLEVGSSNPFVTGMSADSALDDLRIYNTALTAAQVQSVYSSQGAPAPSRAMPLPRYAWTFDRTTTDYVSGVTPLYSGSAQTYGAGKYNQSAVFTNPVATSDTPTYYQFYATSGAFQSSVGFTISFWFNQSNKTSLNSYQGIIGFNSTANSYFNDIFVTPGANGTIGFYGQNPAGSGIGLTIPSPVNAVVGAWYHVAFVMRTGITTMYLNGNLYGSGTYPNEFTISEVRISSTGQYTGHAFCGSVDDLRIFDRALTSAQVQSIYNQQGVPGRGVVTVNSYIANGLVAYYDTQNLRYPNSVSGTTWYDISGNGRSVTIRSGSSYNSSGKYITFDGTANSGTTVAQTGQSLTQWTVMCAFMQTANGSAFARIAGASPNIDAGEIAIYGQTLAINPPESGSWTYTSFTTTYNVWYHMCIAFDTTTTGVVDAWVYINGALVNSYTIDGTVESLTGYVIGNRVDLNGEAMIGRMSLFAIYNRVLSQSEVSANYEFYKKTQIPTYLPVQLTGTPLFSQLSSGATSSAVGAFSLRAVNGTSARAVAVQAHPVVQWPPVALTTNPNTLSSQTYGNGTYTISATATTNGTLYNPFSYATNGFIYWSSPATYNYLGAYTGSNVTASSYFGEWLQIQLPTSITLKTYSVRGRPDATEQTPRTWYIFGSSDGSTWTLLDTQTSVSWPSSGTTLQTFTPSSTAVSYVYFRFVVNAIGTSGYSPPSSISQWILNGSSSSYAPNASQDFYADRLGNLLTTPVTGQSLASWLGGGTGYVTTWYDQSGRGNHATQATAANQPIITKATKGPGFSTSYTGSQFLTINSYTWLNGTPYTICASERRTTGLARIFFGGATPSSQDQKLHNGYKTSTQITVAQYADDVNLTVPDFASGETISYNFFTHNQNHSANIWSYRSSLYQTTPPQTFLNFLNATSGTYTIGTGHSGAYQGEIYELLVFTKSLYDLDGTSTITQIYNNQLSAYGT